MTEYVVSTLAYAKAILHCAKFPSETVQGIILTDGKGPRVRVVDVVPISHHWTELSPMLDIALQQITIYAKTKDLQVGGLYVAYEDTSSTELSASGTLFANTIYKTNSDAVAFVINTKNLAPESAKPAFVPYVYGETHWKEQSNAFVPSGDDSKKSTVFALENSQVLPITKRLLAARAEIGLFDFDEHLDNVSLDWLQNAVLSAQIKSA